jgi:hypothetical protein
MAEIGKMYMPDDEIALIVGRITIRHGQLDHVMRLAIKRMLGVSIDDPGYATATKGMSKDLREKVMKRASERYADEQEKLELIESLLDQAETVTRVRNRLTHSVWMQVDGQPPMMYDKDGPYAIPTIEELQVTERQLDIMQRVLNILTQPGNKISAGPST